MAYATSSAYKNKIYAEDSSCDLKIYINGASIDTDYVREVKLEDSVFESDTFTLGSAIIQKVTLKLDKTCLPCLASEITNVRIEFILDIGNNQTEIIPIGIYELGSDPDTSNEDFVNLTLYDYMNKFDKEYDGSNIVPCTRYELLEDMCNYCGVELGSNEFLNDDILVNTFDSTIKAKTYLSFISERAGGFAKIGRDGKLYIKSFADVDINQVSGNDTASVNINSCDPLKTITKLVYEDAINKWEFGNNNGLTVYLSSENPFVITESEVNTIFNSINGLSFQSIDLKMWGDPSYDTGDIIEVLNMRSFIQKKWSYQYGFVGNYKTILKESNNISNVEKISNKTNIRKIKSSLNDITGEIEIITADVSENTSNISQINLDLNGIDLRVQQNTTNIQTTNSNLATTNSNLATTNSNLSALQTQVNGISADFDDFYDNEYIRSISNLQDQIDGAIQFWNGSAIPTLNNYPANQWTTENEKINHQADIYTVIQDVQGELKQGKSYRFDKVNNVWQWIELTDNELSAVQAIAQEANQRSQTNATNITLLQQADVNLQMDIDSIEASVATTTEQLTNQIEGLEPTGFDTDEEELYLPNSAGKDLIEYRLKGKSEQATSILPDGYTQVDYIESHHAEYIDTGYLCNPNSRIESVLQFTNVEQKQQRVFGNVHTDTDGLSVNIYINGSGYFAWSCQNGVGNWKNTGILADTDKHTFIMDIKNNKVYIDNDYSDNITVSHTNTAIKPLLLLAYRNNYDIVETSTKAYAKLYSTKIYDNDLLVHDYIPCYRNSDNVVGLYDLITNTFLTNQGTGAFTYDIIAILPNPDYPQDVKSIGDVHNLFIKETITEGKSIATSTGGTYNDVNSFCTDFIDVSNIKQLYVNGSSRASDGRLWGAQYDDNKEYVAGLNSSNHILNNFNSNTKYIRLGILNTYLDSLMISENNIDYLPHGNYIDVENKGKNLFNKEYAKNKNNYNVTINNFQCFALQLKPNTKYTISQDMNGYAKTNAYYYDVFNSDKTSIKRLQSKTVEDNLTVTFTTGDIGVIYFGHIYGFSGDNRVPLYLDTAKIQLEEGNATSYEPYIEPIHNYINLTQPLPSLPDGTADELIIKDGHAKIIQNVGRVVLDGSENWQGSASASSQGYRYFYCTGYPQIPKTFSILCDTMQTYTSGALGSTISVSTSTIGSQKSTTNNLRVIFDETIANSIGTFKTWLSKNNTTVQYALSEPIEIDLGEVSIKTINGNDYLYITDPIKSDMYAKYIRNTTLNDVYYTKTETNSQIKIVKDEIDLAVDRIDDLTPFIDSKTGSNYLHLEKTFASEGAIRSLSIKGFTLFPLYPGMSYPSNTQYPGANSCYKLYFDTVYPVSSTKKTFEIMSPIPLQTATINGETIQDELLIENNKISVIQNLGYNSSNQLIKLSESIIHEIGELPIPTLPYDTYITVENYNNDTLSFECEYLQANPYTDIFATQSEMSAKLSITEDNINSKVSKNNLVSEINQSAEEIRITGNRFVVESNNFKLSADGNITSTSGNIGGFDLTADSFKANIYTEYDFTEQDLTNIRNYISGQGTLTPEQIKLYDLNNDGEITAVDYVIVYKLVQSGITKNFPGSFTLNTTDPINTIVIADGYGNVKTKIGATLNNFDTIYAKALNLTNNLSVSEITASGTIYADGYRVVEGSGINRLNDLNSYMEVITSTAVKGINWWDSDKKLKDNISDSNVNALNVIKKIRHREYDRTDRVEHSKLGYIAQELQEIDDSLVFKVKQLNGDEILNINQPNLIPYLTKAIQEQQEIIEKMQEQINNLKERIDNYEKN